MPHQALATLKVAPFRFASAMALERVLQLEDLHHRVREEQPHLREEPPHVEVVGLLHHELGELQRAGADLGGHAHAGLAAVRLERLHEGQESLIWSSKFVTELLPTARSNLAGPT